VFDLKNLDWPLILEKLKNFSTSLSAKDVVASTAPLKSQEEATNSFNEIAQALEVVQLGVRPFMESLDLYNIWCSRLKKRAVLKTIELKDVRSFCLEILALHEALKKVSNPWSQKIQNQLMNSENALNEIDQVITPHGEIRSDASEKLHNLFKEKEKLQREVQNVFDRLVKDHQMENYLQDKYVTTREGRWVLPIKSGMQHFMPGVIHGSSQTKQTVFMEPEKSIPLNNRLRQIDVEIEDEIERILTVLSEDLGRQISQFEESRSLLEQADIRFAQAQLMTLLNANPCQFSDQKIELLQLRHPVLVLSSKEVISNSIHLDSEKSILLLSGPNAGGKTILLKSIGLAAQMARCGLPICAEEGSSLPFFKEMVVAIGDSQSVDQELSTFAAHLKILDQSTRFQGPDHLILIDEICGSTDPEEGSALARSFIETLMKNSVFSVITSHLGPLKSGWDEKSKVLNGSLEYDLKTGRPTYQFLSGIPGDSLALLTAQRVGVNSQLVARAKELLSPMARQRIDALEQLENMKKEIFQLQKQMQKEIHQAHEKKNKYESMMAQFEKEKEQWLQKSLKQAEKRVEEAISMAKVDDTFKKHRNLHEIKFQLPEIVKAKPIVQSVAENAEQFGLRYPPGTKVYIPSLSQDGIVQSAPNSKGEVMIQSQSVRLQMNWKDLKPAQSASNPTAQLVRQSSQFSAAIVDEDKVLDLRGKTVDEALEELEVTLDRCALQKEDRIKIIHGHGTEALKKAVRTHLSRSVYVKKWKAASGEQGGDGVTWAELSHD